MTVWDILIFAVAAGNVLMFGYVVFMALKVKNGPVAAVTGRVKPMIAKGKTLAESGKRELTQNKDRALAMKDEVMGLVEVVRPKEGRREPQLQFNYQQVLTAFSVLGTLRRGLGDVRRTRKVTAHPPGPPAVQRGVRGRVNKTVHRPLGRWEMLPAVVRLVTDVRRAMR